MGGKRKRGEEGGRMEGGSVSVLDECDTRRRQARESRENADCAFDAAETAPAPLT